VIRRLSAPLLAIAALVPVANMVCQAASPSLATRHLHDVVLSGKAKLVGRLPATQTMRLVLVLPQRNQTGLDNFLKEVYDPSSTTFRHFLTVEEFTNRFGPSQEDYDAVVSFAKTHGFTVVGTSPNRMNVDVTGQVSNIEEAFHVTMSVYQHPTEDRTFYSADREPTPDLSVKLWHVSGLDNYSIPRPALVRRSPDVTPLATTGSCPSASFCGSDMRAAYYGGGLTGTGQTLGLLEYAGTDLADLNTYFKNAKQTNNVPITLLSTDGTPTSCLAADGCDDTEQTLDMTQSISMAPGMAGLVMYVGSVDSAIFNAMATTKPLNAQLSSSWYWSPADPATLNPYFSEFAAQGQTMFDAAGDSGAWTTSSSVWPADSVYLVAVGGTDLETASAGGPWASETVWVDGGGGISPNKFAIPSWQVTTAAGCSNCSKTYRNAPDVSANANFTFYVCADQTTCTANDYGGTSFAAPMWAGYMALANEQETTSFGTTLGFINPALYTIGLGSSYDTSFHDITSGSDGYKATVGFDLASGWGSPNGSGLIDALTGTAPAPGFSLSASPSSVTVKQGASGASVITSTVYGGFDSAVTLTAKGQPTGVTVGFSPTSITGAGTSNMSIAVATSTVAGNYTITVTGTSGTTTETTTVLLTVVSPTLNFTITASPSSVSIVRGGSTVVTLTTTVTGGFDSAIALSTAASGVTFSPATIPAPGAGTSKMTIKIGGSTKLGDHTITVDASGGGFTNTVTVTVDVLE
jgi:subtilase family serine protease